MNTTPHGSPRPANRLAAESSPYLLQHAHNPVDWWPWGDAAFTEARRRNVPILLSIGYSTCHWCHVMERECFDNEAIAALLNASFVCIKVDREERPAVDDAYMAATMMLSGHGGWPMTVFLEPTTLAPFWAGTYFPPEPRPEYGNRPSLPQVVEALNAAWRDRRAEVLSQADQVAKAVREHLSAVAPQAQLGQNTVAEAVSQILQQFDRVHGGFGAAPKFPQPVYIDLLAAVRARAADDSTADALDIAVRNSLNAMAVGGIFDQIGGGFHRYSVDASWTIPHFEKMLYDQALLAPQYARAARAFGDPYFEEIARRTLGFVRSTLKGPHGAFLSALDADTNGREGLTYTWTAEEFRSILGEDADHALRFYGLSGPPNFKDPHHPADPAVHLPRLAARPEHLAPGLQMGPAEFSILRHTVNDRLLAARSTRPQPFLDDKVIASWNGLAIAAFAECGMELEDASLIAEASAAADAALSLLSGPDGSLARTWRNGTRSGDPALEDYAAMMKGLLAIAAADAGQRHARTEQALRLFAHAKEHYHDSSGAWFDAPDRAKELFVRPRSTHDGAVPCGCSMMLHNLIDLHELSGAREPLDLALKGIAPSAGHWPPRRRGLQQCAGPLPPAAAQGSATGRGPAARPEPACAAGTLHRRGVRRRRTHEPRARHPGEDLHPGADRAGNAPRRGGCGRGCAAALPHRRDRRHGGGGLRGLPAGQAL